MQPTLTEYDVDHYSFTPVYSHNTRFSKNLNFVIEKPRSGLGQTSLRYLGPKFWYSVPDYLKYF